MNIVLIGAGNLATNLSHALQQAGHTIKQIYSRTELSARTLAESLGASHTTDLETIITDADIYIISVKDSVLESLGIQLHNVLSTHNSNPLIVHTAGSMNMSTLKCNRRGVLYPMQTFSKQRLVSFSNIPCFVETNQAADQPGLMQLAKSISDKVIYLDSDQRKYLHVAAVFCCNFANHCSTLAANLLEQHGIPFDVMLPLIDETTHKLHSLTPLEAQTGPAVRWDENVIERHLNILNEDKRTQQIYHLMSQSIHDHDQLRPEKD